MVRVGGSRAIPVDIRLICATNMDLEALVREGRFREDLYYRINTVHIALPPLRERREDIVPLAQLFLERFAQKYRRPLTGIAPDAAQVLTEGRWSGNIRELQNVIEKAVILSEAKDLTAKDLDTRSMSGRTEAVTPGPTGGLLRSPADEERLVRDAMARADGNISAAAKLLGVSRPTLYADIRKVAYMMDALEDGELNFRFKDSNKFNRTLNRIRTIFETQRQAHEQDSWTKLIRVLTHEIMNTVSPIASLSDAMARSVDENGRSELDIKAGLETISDSSKNLIGFVQTYRQLSGVARPVRKALDLQELMDGVLALNSEYTASCGAVCSYRPEEPDLMIYADEGQISQILINLIKNALQAGAKHIDISAGMGKDDEVLIRVANDGEPIPVSAQEQIFIPFYTTKKEGSGIGLSISRQIMRNHNGSIELVRSDEAGTEFLLVFR